MDSILERLWALATADATDSSAATSTQAKTELVAEAQALWRTLETLLATLRTQDLSVGDAAFTKLLACVRSVLREPEYWRVHAVDKHDKGVFVFANRVIVKLACRGERERETLAHDGLVELLVASMRHQSDSTVASSAVLQVLQTLAFDATNRQALDAADTLPFTLALMKKHPHDAHVQVFGCKFLQLMVYDDKCKATLVRAGAVLAALTALRRFPSDEQVAASALDLVYFLSADLERGAATQTQQPLGAAIDDIVESAMRAMRAHSAVLQVQTHGMAILNSAVSHAQARRMMCAMNIWELVLHALRSGSSDRSSSSDAVETTTDALDVLETLLSDGTTVESVTYTLAAPSVNDRTKRSTLQTLEALLATLESLAVATINQSKVQSVACRLQALVHPNSAPAVAHTNRSASEPLTSQASACDRLHSPSPDANDGRNTHTSYAATTTSHSSRLDIDGDDESESEMPLAEAASAAHYSATPMSIERKLFANRMHSNALHHPPPTLMTLSSASSASVDTPETSRSFDSIESPPPSPIDARQRRSTLHDLAQPTTDSLSFLDDLALDSGTGGYFDKFLRDADERFKPSQAVSTVPQSQPSVQSSQASLSGTESSSSESWRAQYERCAAELQALQTAYHNVQEHCTIATRRAAEQTKLLRLQNSRIASHMDIHAQVLARVQSLEDALEAATRKAHVERELRRAEVAQCERMTRALHDARKEIQTLSSQNSSASRELQHREKLRVDSQLKTSAIKHLKEKVELERDDAIIRAQTMQFEKVELVRQLEACRRECLEALRMREEDVNAPKPRVFAAIGRSHSPTKSTHGSRVSATTAAALTAARRASAWTSDSDAPVRMHARSFAVQPIDTSVAALSSSSSFSSSRTSPRKQSVFASLEHESSANAADPATIERDDIEASLQAIFDSLNTSLDGHGVHIATVRRFLLESGLVQPPHVVAADVDVILAKVLSQAQEHRRSAVVRRDYAFAQLAPSTAAATATDAKRYRYFDQDAFNEAVTLVGVKRFPRLDLKRVLQTVVAEFLYPIQRRMRTTSMLACAASGATSAPLARSHSTLALPSASFCGSPSATSPSSSVCVAVMRAVLNGLALHIGPGNATESASDVPSDPLSSDSRRPSLVPDATRKPSREDVVYSMLEMHTILAREQRPLSTICEFYSAIHLQHVSSSSSASARDDLLGLSFDLVLNFAMDFEIIPSFMDRVSLKHLCADVAALIKSYLALHKRFPHATDAETLKKVAFTMLLARLAIELFRAKSDFETPEKQITGLLQWLDNSAGREKILRKAMLPLVIKFSRKLYALKA